MIRGVGLRLFNLQLAKGKSLKPHEFMAFPWDEEEVVDDGGISQMTEEEKKASIAELMKHVNW